MSKMGATRTEGAARAGDGTYVFNLANVNHLNAGPDYSTSNGSVVEGDRMMVALMRMPAGTGADEHWHPSEQWIYVLEGNLVGSISGRAVEARPGAVIYIPANEPHTLKATSEKDVVFFTVKDTSHSIHGIKAR